MESRRELCGSASDQFVWCSARTRRLPARSSRQSSLASTKTENAKQTTTLPHYNYSHTQTFSLATPDDTKRDGAAHSHHHTNRHQLQHRYR